MIKTKCIKCEITRCTRFISGYNITSQFATSELPNL